ncbi:hypothetical protein HX024_17865 [Myroides marinus]|uniref:hypothetical protein n=1 Tax=Myroides marinus TaxID=703342 RepID=UPI002576859E|nr:hypothetical protein [Myroides marinus]MDM1384529.1 hypothetical protein [Myroides marinus]
MLKLVVKIILNKFLLFLILYSSSTVVAQNKKEVTDGIFVTFPSTPEYKALQGNLTYSGKTENALYMAIVVKNVIPNYSEYVQAQKTWSEKEKQQIIDALLDNAVRGKLDYTDSQGSSNKIKKGNYQGRTIQYQAINPLTGNKGNVNSTILLVRNSLVSFEVWNTKEESSSASKEREKFLNSISTN